MQIALSFNVMLRVRPCFYLKGFVLVVSVYSKSKPITYNKLLCCPAQTTQRAPEVRYMQLQMKVDD
jgi:hypothetical protein